MPVHTYWIEEPAIMAVDFSGEITVDDMRKAILPCVISLREHPVYFLIDMSASTHMDIKIMELSSLSEWIYHPNGRWFAYVQPNRLFQNLVRLRHHGNYKFFDDRQQAVEFLKSSHNTFFKI
jgi:tricorn protease-like protein